MNNESQSIRSALCWLWPRFHIGKKQSVSGDFAMRMESGIVSDVEAASENFSGCSFAPYQHQLPEFFSHLSAIKQPLLSKVVEQNHTSHWPLSLALNRVNNCSSLLQCQLFLPSYLHLKLKIQTEPSPSPLFLILKQHFSRWFVLYLFFGNSHVVSDLWKHRGFYKQASVFNGKTSTLQLSPFFLPTFYQLQDFIKLFLVNLSDTKRKETNSSTFIIMVPERSHGMWPRACLQGTVKLGQFTAQFRMWQSGSEQGERQDRSTALSHRKQKVKWHVTV